MNGPAINPALNHLRVGTSTGLPGAHGMPLRKTGLADFNQRAGIPHPQAHHNHIAHHHRPIQVRVAKTRGHRLLEEAQTSRSGRKGTKGTSKHLRATALALVEALHLGHGDALEQELASDYDALEQHILLREARLSVDEEALDPLEKDHLKNQLNEMIANLMDQHGDVIRTGLRDAGAFETALGAMQALSEAEGKTHDPDSLHALRAMHGGSTDGNFDAPFTPLALMTSLQDKFGTDNVGNALADLRSKMATGLRSRTTTGPRLWLSLSDAACFRTVQSSVMIAGDLRGAMSVQAQAVPKADQIGIAMALLDAAESGTGTSTGLTGRIVEPGRVPPLRRTQLYLLIREAVRLLPTTAWKEEHLPGRMKLLDELRALAFGASSDIPAAWSEEAQLEARLRGDDVRQQAVQPRNEIATKSGAVSAVAHTKASAG